MQIVRCCDRVRLPDGERKWRRMARLAKFDGTVRVRGFRPSDQIRPKGITLGTMSLGGKVITIHVNHNAPHVEGVGEARHYDPFGTFGHELGHFILKQRGRRYHSPQRASDKKGNAVERACDRYSRLLRSKS